MQEGKEAQWNKDAELWAKEKRAFESRQAELEKEIKELKKTTQK